MKSLLGFGRRFGTAALGAAVALALAGSAGAATYSWVGGGADGNWSTTGNWSGTAPSGTGAAADVMYFYNGVTLTDGANVTSIHDLGNPFYLRRVYLTGAGPATGSAVVTIQGNDLKLDASAAYEHVKLDALGTNLTYNLNVNLIGSGGNSILFIGNGTAMFNFSGSITSGIASSQIALRKDGASTLRFPNPLTTEGKIHWVRATAGVLELANGFDLGTRGVYLGGGTVRFSGAGSVVGAVCNIAGGAIEVVEGLTVSLAPSQLTQNSPTAGVRLTGRGKLLITSASGTAATIGAYPLDIAGTLEVGKNNAINPVVLLKMSDGGTFNTAGFDQTFASLTLGGGNSTIDLGASAVDSQLQFGDSSALAWDNGSVLTITNWAGLTNPTSGTPGNEYVRFSQTDGAGLTTDQSLMVQFVNPSGFTAGTYSPRIVTVAGATSYDYLVPNVGIPTALAATAVGSSGFTASWTAALLATGYRLDVSTDADFSTFVTGYQDLNVGDVQTYAVSGLEPVTTHYYRVRAANANGDSANSNVIATQTTKNNGAVILIR
jgi:hypothetical protein